MFIVDMDNSNSDNARMDAGASSAHTDGNGDERSDDNNDYANGYSDRHLNGGTGSDEASSSDVSNSSSRSSGDESLEFDSDGLPVDKNGNPIEFGESFDLNNFSSGTESSEDSNRGRQSDIEDEDEETAEKQRRRRLQDGDLVPSTSSSAGFGSEGSGDYRVHHCHQRERD